MAITKHPYKTSPGITWDMNDSLIQIYKDKEPILTISIAEVCIERKKEIAKTCKGDRYEN